VLSVAIEALTAFIRSFVYPIIATADGGILLNPVLAYLGGCVKNIFLFAILICILWCLNLTYIIQSSIPDIFVDL
jgi:hypothetical protein